MIDQITYWVESLPKEDRREELKKLREHVFRLLLNEVLPAGGTIAFPKPPKLSPPPKLSKLWGNRWLARRRN